MGAAVNMALMKNSPQTFGKQLPAAELDLPPVTGRRQ